MLLFFSIVLSVLFIALYLPFFLICRHAKKLPPSPPSWFPIIGNLHLLGSLPHRSLRELSNKHGPLMLLHLGRVQAVVISSAELAQEVMKTQDRIFSNRAPSSIAKALVQNRDIIFAPYGDYWRLVRKIFVSHMMRSSGSLQLAQLVREEEVSLLVDRIRSCQQQRGSVNLTEMLFKTMNNIICRVAFGKKYCETWRGDNLQKILNEYTELLGSFPVADFIPWLGCVDWLSGLNTRVKNLSKTLDEFLEGVLEEHLRAGVDGDRDGQDFVQLLLSLEDKGVPASDTSLDKTSIKALLLEVFASGTNSAVKTLEWAMTELISNPKLMKRAQEEVKGIVGSKLKITEDDIGRMNYVKSIIKETLRLHGPPLLVPRETIEDTKLQGYHIPARTRVIVNAWAIARDPSAWEMPENFWPDRFMNNNIDFKGKDFQFIPFGAGRRGCPGINYVIPNIELTLAYLLHHFVWGIPKGIEGEVLDMSEAFGLTLRKKGGLCLIVESIAS